MSHIAPADLTDADRAVLATLCPEKGPRDHSVDLDAFRLTGQLDAVRRLAEGGWVVVWGDAVTLTPWGAWSHPEGPLELHEDAECKPRWRRRRELEDAPVEPWRQPARAMRTLGDVAWVPSRYLSPLDLMVEHEEQEAARKASERRRSSRRGRRRMTA